MPVCSSDAKAVTFSFSTGIHNEIPRLHAGNRITLANLRLTSLNAPTRIPPCVWHLCLNTTALSLSSLPLFHLPPFILARKREIMMTSANSPSSLLRRPRRPRTCFFLHRRHCRCRRDAHLTRRFMHAPLRPPASSRPSVRRALAACLVSFQSLLFPSSFKNPAFRNTFFCLVQ